MNFQKYLNKEFKPGTRISQKELIAAIESEWNVAEAAIIPCSLDDFIEKAVFTFIYLFQIY